MWGEPEILDAIAAQVFPYISPLIIMKCDFICNSFLFGKIFRDDVRNAFVEI